MNQVASIKIEKNIPPPTKSATPSSKFAAFEVGDSAFFPDAVGATIAPTVSYYGRRNNKKFTTRTVTEGGVKGIRVWRIA